MLNKLKELSKDTAVYGISTIVGRFLGFLLVPFYTNVFTREEFGIFTLIYAYLAFLNIVYIYGMDAAYMKYTSLAEGEEKKNTFSTPYIFVTGTSILLSVIFYIFKEEFGAAIALPSEYFGLLIYVILILFFDTLALIPFNALRLERKTKKFALIKLMNIVINLSLNLILILKYDFGIEAIFISNLAASIFSFVVLIPDLIKRFRLKIDKPILVKMLKFGIPYLPAALASTVVQIIDVPIVERLTNTETLGLYRANYKLGIFMMLFVQMFNFAWQPFFLENAKEKNAKEFFSKILTIFLIIGSIIWITTSLFIEDIAKIEIINGRTLLGKEFLEGLYIVPIILLAYLFNGLYVNFTAGIYIEEKTKYFVFVTGAGAIVNVIINLILIPQLGIMGAALATLASYVVMALGLFIVSQKFYKINYEYLKIIKIFLIIFASGIFYFYLYYNGALNIGIKFLIFLVSISALFILKVINYDEIVRTFKSFKKRKEL